MSEITFLGAAQTVTGSRHLLRTTRGHRVLVDCGMFQGLKALRERNWQELGVVPSSTRRRAPHARPPGPLSAGCHDSSPPDTGAASTARRARATSARSCCPMPGRIQEEDARQANKHHYTKHAPARPLFTEDDARRALTLLQPVGFGVPLPVVPGLTAEFIRAGHLLGSSFIRVTQDDAPRTILFGGDLGRYDRPVLPDPTPVAEADVLLVESTYGNRTHEPDDDGASLAAVIVRTYERGGRLVIPSFAIGRVEELLYWLQRLEKEARIPSMPTYVDSPMAAEAINFYSSRPDELDPEMRPVHRGPMFDTRRLHVIKDTEESKALTRSSGPGDHHLVERHGDGRPRAAPPEAPAARREEHGPVRRLPGGGHPRPPAGGRREDRQDPRRGDPGGGARRQERPDVGARRPRRDPPLAARLLAPAGADLPRARRGPTRWARWRPPSARTSAGPCISRSIAST